MDRRLKVVISIVAVVAGCLIVWGLVEGWFGSFWARVRDFAIWAEPFSPFGTSLVAALAGIIAWLTYRHRRQTDVLVYLQRQEADSRAEWWRRVQSAIDLATVEPGRIGRATGIVLLSHLSQDPNLSAQDIKIIRDMVKKLVNELVNDIFEEKRQEKQNRGLRWFGR